MPTYRIPVQISGFSGGPGVNVFHGRVTDPAQLDETLLDALYDFYGGILGLYPAGVSLNVDPSTIVDVATKEIPSGVTGWSLAGAGSSSKAPAPVALVVGWRTSLSARRGRGRTFISPLVASVTDTDGTPRATELTTLRNAATALVTASTGANGWALGVYGQEAQGQAATHVLRDVVSASVRDTFAVLRSRRD